jgi:hypothetical protein
MPYHRKQCILAQQGSAPVAPQQGAPADAARGDKIGRILESGVGSKANPPYRCGAAERQAVGPHQARRYSPYKTHDDKKWLLYMFKRELIVVYTVVLLIGAGCSFLWFAFLAQEHSVGQHLAPIPAGILGRWSLIQSAMHYSDSNKTDIRQSDGEATIILTKDGQYEIIYTVSSATYSGRYWMISANEMEIDIERSPVNKHGPPYRQFFTVSSDVLTITRIVKRDNGSTVTNIDTYRKIDQ